MLWQHREVIVLQNRKHTIHTMKPAISTLNEQRLVRIIWDYDSDCYRLNFPFILMSSLVYG